MQTIDMTIPGFDRASVGAAPGCGGGCARLRLA
jgi:hypothetical protein